MPYRYLDDIAIADAAFEAWGATREELFAACADALVNVMVEELDAIGRIETVEVSLQEIDLEMLLFNFLNELLYYKDAQRLLLRAASLTIGLKDGLFHLHATLYGEEAGRLATHADVKAVTMHRFRVEQTGKGWEATVVLDI